MITVYVIYEFSINEIYVGLTNNLDRRIKEHKPGQSSYTKKFTNHILIHTENFPNYTEARKREKQLKHGSGKEFLKSKIAGIV